MRKDPLITRKSYRERTSEGKASSFWENWKQKGLFQKKNKEVRERESLEEVDSENSRFHEKKSSEKMDSFLNIGIISLTVGIIIVTYIAFFV